MIASVAFLVKTISLESDALMKVATFFLANSYSFVAFALNKEETVRKKILTFKQGVTLSIKDGKNFEVVPLV